MILVTTPNGKVGSEVVRQLMALGSPVRIGAHTPEKASRAFPGAEVVPFDYADESSVAAALRGVTVLYQAAPGEEAAGPVNRAVDLAREAGVRRVVKLSAMGAEQGDSALRQAEKHIEGSGLAWTHLRPSWFMQNYSTGQAGSIRTDGAFYEPSGDARTGFVDARDIAAVAVKALTEEGHEGQAYPITGGQAHSRQDVAAAISAATGKKVRYVAVSDEDFRASVTALGWPSTYVELMSFIYGAVRAGYTEVVTDTIERVTGRPPVTLERFTQDYRVAWL